MLGDSIDFSQCYWVFMNNFKKWAQGLSERWWDRWCRNLDQEQKESSLAGPTDDFSRGQLFLCATRLSFSSSSEVLYGPRSWECLLNAYMLAPHMEPHTNPKSRDFSGGPAVRLCLPVHRVQVQSLVGQLRSHIHRARIQFISLIEVT